MFSNQITRLLLTTLLFLVTTIPILAATKKTPTHPININSAKSEELQQVPGIGPSTAEKILQMRKSYGPFKSVDDLKAVRGLGPKRLEKMRKYLTAGKFTPNSAKPPTPGKSTVRAPQPDNCAGCPKTTPTANRKQTALPRPAKAPANRDAAKSATSGDYPADDEGEPESQ
jgi:competence ComEA-like helix-hairpin-helix protein